jgi:hypothetical protein
LKFASRALCAVSLFILALTLVEALGIGLSIHVGPMRLRSADAMRPLIVAAAAAWLSLAFADGRLRRSMRRMSIALTVAILALIFVRAMAPDYATGDAAFLELYTLHSVRGIWPFGPYSQFGWHHPGPLYFYLLAPLYAAGGFRFAALNVGASLINAAAAVLLLSVLRRRASRSLVIGVAVALLVYVARLSPMFVSAWNPHVLVLPMAAMLATAVSWATDDVYLAPTAVALGSFLVQTHIGLTPIVALLCSGAVVANLLGIRSGRLQRPAVFVWWNRAAWVMALCWVLPLAEELLDSPGNLTLIARFFGNGQHPQSFIDGFKIWAVMISGVLLPRLVPPTGNPIAPDPSAVAVVLALSQMVGMLVAVAAALGKRRRFDALFGAAGLLSAVVALWSVSNVPVIIGDYHVFWISIIGALNWGVLGAAVSEPVVGRLVARTPRRLATLAYPAFMLVLLIQPLPTLVAKARASGRDSDELKVSADVIGADMFNLNVSRALLRGGPLAWGEQGGVALELYKRHVPIAVDAGSVFMYGKPLAANGHEQAIYVVNLTAEYRRSPDPSATILLAGRKVTVTRSEIQPTSAETPTAAR